MTSRIEPGGPRDIGVAAWAGSRLAGRVMQTQPPAFITVLGRGRRQFWGWLAFAGTLMPFGRLPRRETEAVILRVAALSDCEYERVHHERLGARAGLSAEEITDLRAATRDESRWSPRENVVLDTADALVQQQDLDDEQWRQLRDELDERECLELVQLVGQYVLLATTLRVLRVPPDRRTRPE